MKIVQKLQELDKTEARAMVKEELSKRAIDVLNEVSKQTSSLNYNSLHLEPKIGPLDSKFNNTHDFKARVQALHGNVKPFNDGSTNRYYTKKNKIVATYDALLDIGHVYDKKPTQE